MEELDKVGAIENRHRKEKKELQAKIQALKKTAKNDKTKKKELVSEIARLENELETRHKQELLEYEQIHGDNEDNPIEHVLVEAEVDTFKQKPSKAQKRREKKSQQEKEREEQIKLQEKENLHGPRNTETQAIKSKLKHNNLQIFSIPSDGDCLYKAVSHQLQLTRQLEVTIADLRSKVSSYIHSNKDDFMPFMSNPETCEMLTDEQFEQYCDKIRNTKVWGGQLEIRALSNLLKCPINVIQATGPDCIKQGTEFDGPPLNITYHRHMYSLGEHYNSTIAIPLENDGD